MNYDAAINYDAPVNYNAGAIPVPIPSGGAGGMAHELPAQHRIERIWLDEDDFVVMVNA